MAKVRLNPLKNQDIGFYSVFIVFLILSCHIQSPPNLEASSAPRRPMPQRVAEMDIIVVGELVAIEENTVTIDHAAYMTDRMARFFLHTGIIRADSLLKHFDRRPSPELLAQAPQEYRVVFFSDSHPQPVGCSKGSLVNSSHFGFNQGQKGIWFLQWNHLVEHFTVTHRANLIPIASLQTVQQSIDKTLEFIHTN